jgi:O-antigen biosynthesis alpha-1,2-mannosyltransferase
MYSSGNNIFTQREQIYYAKDFHTKNVIFNGNINHKGYSLSIVNNNFINSLKHYVNNITILDDINENEFVNTKNNILMFMGYPPTYSENYKICVNYGWEESVFPEEFLTRFQKLDYITVMSEYVKYTLINNGLKIPIFVTNISYEHNENESNIVTNKNNYIIDTKKKFKLLHISSCFKRKGIDELLEAYFKGFSGDDDICLYIKTFHNIHNKKLNIKINSYKTNNINPPEIIINFEIIKSKDIESLINSSSCIINPSNSEGFGLPALEAMIKRKPVIVTNYSGFKDFCNAKNSFLLDFEYVHSESHFTTHYKPSYYAKAKINSIIYNIKKVMSLTHDEILQHVEYAYNSVKHLTWNNNVKNNIKAYYLSKKIITNTPKIGVMTTLSNICGIGIYAQQLFKMRKDITFLIPENEYCEFDGENIIKSWQSEILINNEYKGYPVRYRNKSVLCRCDKWCYHKEYMAVNFINIAKKMDVIIINYAYSICITILERIFRELKLLNKIIILELHATDSLSHFNTNTVSTFLSCVDLTHVHQIKDVNTLKSIYNYNNTLLLPHPIKEYNNVFKINKTIKRLATFGFCFKDKGLIQLIKSFKLLNNSELELNLYCSTHHKFVDPTFVKEINTLIKNDKNIVFNKTHYNPEEIHRNLSNNDLIIFPALESEESASGSIRNAISTLKPIIISNSGKFKDFLNRNFIYKYSDCNSIQLLKEKIEEVLLLDPKIHIENSKLMLKYVKENSFDKAHTNILNVCHSLFINKLTKM